MNPEKIIFVISGAHVTSFFLQFSPSDSSWCFCLGYRANYPVLVPSLGICRDTAMEGQNGELLCWLGTGPAFEGYDKGPQKCTLKQ